MDARETKYEMSVARKITQQDGWSYAQPEELVGKLHGQGRRDIARKTHSGMAKKEETSLERRIAEISWQAIMMYNKAQTSPSSSRTTFGSFKK